MEKPLSVLPPHTDPLQWVATIVNVYKTFKFSFLLAVKAIETSGTETAIGFWTNFSSTFCSNAKLFNHKRHYVRRSWSVSFFFVVKQKFLHKTRVSVVIRTKMFKFLQNITTKDDSRVINCSNWRRTFRFIFNSISSLTNQSRRKTRKSRPSYQFTLIYQKYIHHRIIMQFA